MRQAAATLAVMFVLVVSSSATEVVFRSTTEGGAKKDLIRQVKLQGELRMRAESLVRRTAPNITRDRGRFRLRYGAEAALPSDMSVGIGFASGTGEPAAENQSFDNLGGGKQFWLDKVYIQWSPKPPFAGKSSFSVGRIVNPLWVIESSDLVWDTDFNPEGLGESLRWDAGGGTLFVNGLQMVTDEDADSRADQYMVGGQLGGEFSHSGGAKLKLAGAWYEWTNSRVTDFGAPSVQSGNRRLGARTLNDFKVGELTAQISAKPGGVPTRLQGTVIRNFAAITEEQAGRGEQGRNQAGWQTGLILGEAAEAKTWEAGYFYKWTETDSTVADVTESDFGLGGTNRKGHAVWAAYSPNDWNLLKAKFYYTSLVADGLPPGAAGAVNRGDDINRVQFDWTVKF